MQMTRIGKLFFCLSVLALCAQVHAVESKPWDPSHLGSAVALWLDAADASTITLNASTVSQWNDKSGNSRNVSQGDASKQPTYSRAGLNGKNVLDCGEASNNIFLSWSGAAFSPIKVFGVVDWDGGSTFSSYEAIIQMGGAGDGFSIQGWIGGTSLFGGTTLFLNGSSSATGNVLRTMDSPALFMMNQKPSSDRKAVTVCGDGGNTRGWRGKLGEIIMLQSEPTLADRQKIEGYLAWKWSINANLPADHPYKNERPTM